MDEAEFEFSDVIGDKLPALSALALELMGGLDAQVQPGGAFSFSESLAAGTDAAVFAPELVLNDIALVFKDGIDIA